MRVGLPRNVALIASNEIHQRFRSKAFRIGFAAMAVLVALAASLPGILAKDPKRETFMVATLGADIADVGQSFVTVKFQPVKTRREGLMLVNDRTVVALLTNNELIVKSGVDFRVGEIAEEVNAARVLRSRAAKNAVSTKAVQELLKPIAPLTFMRLDPGRNVDGKAVALGSITQVLLLMAISLFGGR